MAMINTSLDQIIQCKDITDERLSMQAKSAAAGRSGHRITVSNLNPDDLKVKELEDMFSDFGKILSLKVIKKESERSKKQVDGDDGEQTETAAAASTAVVKIRYNKDAEVDAAVDCWNGVYVGKSLMKVERAPSKSRRQMAEGDVAGGAAQEDEKEEDGRSSLNSSFSELSSIGQQQFGRHESKVRRPRQGNYSKKRWGGSKVTKEDLDKELDDYMNARK